MPNTLRRYSLLGPSTFPSEGPERLKFAATLQCLVAALIFFVPVLRAQQSPSGTRAAESANKAIMIAQEALAAMMSHGVESSALQGQIEDERGVQQGTFAWRTRNQISDVPNGGQIRVVPQPPPPPPKPQPQNK